MEGFIYDLNLIKGLNQASQLPVPLFNYLIEEVLKFIMDENNQLDCNLFEDVEIFEGNPFNFYYKLCEKEEIHISAEKISNITDSFIYLLRFYYKKEINSNQILAFLQENTVLEEKYLTPLRALLEGKNKKITNILRLSQLRNIQWSLRNYQGDDKYPEMSRLYILLELNLQDNQGLTTKESINLTLTEFKVFMSQIKEITELSSEYQ